MPASKRITYFDLLLMRDFTKLEETFSIIYPRHLLSLANSMSISIYFPLLFYCALLKDDSNLVIDGDEEDNPNDSWIWGGCWIFYYDFSLSFSAFDPCYLSLSPNSTSLLSISMSILLNKIIRWIFTSNLSNIFSLFRSTWNNQIVLGQVSTSKLGFFAWISSFLFWAFWVYRTFLSLLFFYKLFEVFIIFIGFAFLDVLKIKICLILMFVFSIWGLLELRVEVWEKWILFHLFQHLFRIDAV